MSEQLSLAEEQAIEEEIGEILSRILMNSAHEVWYITQIRSLGNETPATLLQEHRHQELLNYVKTYLDPSFS